MKLDDIKGRTYSNHADFWRDIDRVVADVRRETREATIRECLDAIAGLDTATAARNCILALLTPPSAPAERKCKVCGELRDDFGNGAPHDFEPEEPGHG